MTENLLYRRTLPNGLILEFYDRSRPMAGDRWQVILEVRLPITVSAAILPPDLADRAQEVIAALGPEVIFIQQEVRHFIDRREVSALLTEMQTRLLQGLEGYLGHPEFGGRFIRKKFAEYQERQKWYKDMEP
uniref:Uncharacterized protein n=1 Tax=Desulfobacca acetoxidans TaxID=60893 RepID=A0A7C3Z348_9BACT